MEAVVEATRTDGMASAKAVTVSRPEDPVDATRCATKQHLILLYDTLSRT